MEITLLRNRIGPFVLLGFAVVFFLAAAFSTGMIQTLGYENRRITFSGFASGTGAGTSLGLKDMLFFEGQEFFAEFDAEVSRGVFRIRIADLFAPIGVRHFVESIPDSREGEVTYRIPKTGLYTIDFDGSVGLGGGGYDIAYSVRWGAR